MSLTILSRLLAMLCRGRCGAERSRPDPVLSTVAWALAFGHCDPDLFKSLSPETA